MSASDHLPETFELLFDFLRLVGYEWEPQSPDRLQKLRKTPETFGPLIRYFGLGLPVPLEELELEGMPSDLFEMIEPLRPAISRVGGIFVPHSHWPPLPEKRHDFVYFGQESLTLIRMIQPLLHLFEGKQVLDIGCASGGLSFEIAALSRQVLGLDSCAQATVWASAAAEAQRFLNARFAHATIGQPQAEAEASGISWDYALFNPPMTIPRTDSPSPHRDGGRLGVELPLAFLDFAGRHLRISGEVLCLVTNPIVGGRPVFFDELVKRGSRWKILKKQCLNDHFNQSLHRQDNYDEMGIHHIELWFLHLAKLGA